MDQTRVRLQINAPDTRSGALVLWVGLSMGAVVLSYLSASPASLPNRAFFAFALTLPVLAMAKRGHFGSGDWSFPTIPAQVYLIWNIGLLPSLAGAAFQAHGQFHYASPAKWIGASAFLIWFLAFTTGAGGAIPRRDPVESRRHSVSKWGRPELILVLLLFSIWLVSGGFAVQLNALSSWTQTNITELQGSSGGAVLIFYWSLVPVIPMLGLCLLRFGQPSFRWVGIGILIVGLLALIAFSNRRLTVYLALLALYTLWRSGARIPVKHLVGVGIGVGLLMGPLLWPIRIAAYRPELFRTQGHPIRMAWEALVRYGTDPQFRRVVSEAGAENLQEGRFNYSDTYLAGISWEQEHGPHLSPTILFAPVVMTPSFIWPGKTNTADELNIKRQFNQLGIANRPDFAVNPILESMFEFGLVGVACLGFLWGKMARLLDQSFESALRGLAGTLVWMSMFLGIIAFEAYITAFIVDSRQALLLAAVIGIAQWTLKGRPDAPTVGSQSQEA